MKKRILKILAVILIIIVCSAGFIVYSQWDNIQAVAYYTKYSNDEISTMITENDQKVSKAVEKLPDITIHELTADEKEALKTGALSQEDTVNIILGKSVLVKEGENYTVVANETSDNSVEENSTDEIEAAKQRVAENIAQIYVYKEQYSNELDSILKSAMEEYKSLPSGERNSKSKEDIAFKYLDVALNLEKECDANMEAIIKEISSDLKIYGGDKSVVDDIKEVYENEKSLKKAYYLSIYN